MATSENFVPVRYYTGLDPYFYATDNRPLTDLDANIQTTASGVDAAKRAALVNGLTTGFLAGGILGNTTTLVADVGFPGSLTFTVSPGFMSAREAISDSDNRLVTKLALLVDQFSATLSAPGTAGRSIAYLVQGRFVDVTTTTDSLPNYDAFNPHAPGSIMTGVLELNIKAGSEATTGAELAPAADGGWSPLFTITVADTTVNLSQSNLTLVNAKSVGTIGGGDVDIVAATEIVPGIIRLATDTEAQEKTISDAVITPANLEQLGATTTSTGLVELATNTEAAALSSTSRVITASNLGHVFNTINASTTAFGTIQLADNATTETGTDANKAVTPASLSFVLGNWDFSGSVGSASNSVAGIVELADNSETLTGTDNTRAVTPASLKHVLDNTAVSVDNATTATAGIAALASNAEASAGTNTTKIITPATLKYAVENGVLPAASSTVAGIVELATSTEVANGSSTGLAVTPAGASATYMKKSGGTFTGNITAPDITATGTLKGAFVRSTSARKYKENIETITGALDICSLLRGVSYTWKDSGVKDYGLIADELFEVLPELVEVQNGEIEGMDYGHLVGVLINAVNELKAEVDALKTK